MPILYNQVLTLNTKLASAESMTHDVIRDLLSVKLDISNFAVSSGLGIQDIGKILLESSF